jgi:hypothetical protein
MCRTNEIVEKSFNWRRALWFARIINIILFVNFDLDSNFGDKAAIKSGKT